MISSLSSAGYSAARAAVSRVSSSILPWPFTASAPPPGLPAVMENLPKLFTPLAIGPQVVLKNRIAVSPMCQYSSTDGFLNDFHLVQLGQFAIGGSSLIVQEATAIQENGRITPYCAGLWKDDHIEQSRRLVNFLHSQGALVAIQLGHAGRKSSTLPPFMKYSNKDENFVREAEKGWPNDVIGPSAIPFGPNWLTPREASMDDINNYLTAWKEATRRALAADYDIIEIHAAHGYLLSSFLSPLSNHRSDDYGGSFENRIRLLLETVAAVRSVWPKEKPLFVRISCEEWVSGGWNNEDSVRLAPILSFAGVDLLDCSSGGNNFHQKIPLKAGYQVTFSQQIKKKNPDSSLLTGTVGLITTGKQAESILQEGAADLIFLAREFLRNPQFPFTAAEELGVSLSRAPQNQRASLHNSGVPAAAPTSSVATSSLPASTVSTSAVEDSSRVCALKSLSEVVDHSNKKRKFVHRHCVICHKDASMCCSACSTPENAVTLCGPSAKRDPPCFTVHAHSVLKKEKNK